MDVVVQDNPDVIAVAVNDTAIQVIDSEFGIPVTVTEEIVNADPSVDAIAVAENNETIVITEHIDALTVSETDETLAVTFAEVLIQHTETIVEVDTEIPMPYNQEIDFVGETIVYKGWAATGGATSAAIWRIQRITFLNEEGDTRWHWADGNGEFDNVWDDRASLSYS